MAKKSSSTKMDQPPDAATTLKERRAAGKALREKVPRNAHALWKAPARRRNAVDLLIESSQGRIPELLPIRYYRMMQTPFSFYRGAAAIMAADLATTPVTGIRVQACGDCHLMNFGAFATPERRVVFDINDFDETLPAPWEWDVKRLAASFVIASRNNRYKERDAREAALQCVKAYRENMADSAQMRVLKRWHQSIEISEILQTAKSRFGKKDSAAVQKRVEKEASRNVAEDDFPKLAAVEAGRARIKDAPPLIYHPPGSGKADFERLIVDTFQKYRSTLPDAHKRLVDHYEIKDLAVKVVGVGSVGTRCAILLMMAGDDDPLFLQVKEARVSVLEPYAGESIYSNRGQRVVNGQRLMQSASDIFLGWTEARQGRHYYVRQLRDTKIKPLVETFVKEWMMTYAGHCGRALAHAHAKAGYPGVISGYLGSGDSFDEAIADFAVAYADQNEKDHAALLQAVRAGKIQVQEG